MVPGMVWWSLPGCGTIYYPMGTRLRATLQVHLVHHGHVGTGVRCTRLPDVLEKCSWGYVRPQTSEAGGLAPRIMD